MLDFIFIVIYVFLELLFYLIIIDVILSYLMLFGIRIRPRFISDIIDPIYKKVKSIFPTTFGPFDFTPIIVIIAIYFLIYLLYRLNPGAFEVLKNFIK